MKVKLDKIPLWTIFVGLIVFAQFLFIYAVFIEPNWIAVKKARVVCPELAGALEGVRVVHISDMHVNRLGYREMSLVEKVNELKPDVILMTGDLLGAREGVQVSWDVLGLMEPEFWIYAITGEKEHMYAHDLLTDRAWKKTGITFIDGAAIKVNWQKKKDGGLWLVGAGPTERNKLAEITAGIPKGEPALIMSHRTDTVKEAAVLGLPFVIAGDTHGGQINPAWIRNFFPVEEHGKYIAGFYKVKETLMYVNRGIGTSRVNARFFCRPEITLYEFVPEGRMRGVKVLREDRN